MSIDTIQERMYRGYAKTADKIGRTFSLYRPSSPMSVIEPENVLSEDFRVCLYQEREFKQSNKYGNAMWKGYLDGRVARVFDYVSNGEETYFINGMPTMLPITLIECNALVKIQRPIQPTGVGAVGYGGSTRHTDEVLMEGWPCSQLVGSKWERNATSLPSDERLPWFIFLIPYWPGIELRTSDIIVDGLGRRTAISTYERTNFGWRVSAGLSGA